MRTIKINEIDVTDSHAVYTCYGLGSCIGLFLNDRTIHLSGAAHIPMPVSMSNEMLAAEQMINELLTRFSAYGSSLLCLRAKIAGGARIYEGALDTGCQNVDAVTQALRKHKVYVAATHVGGKVSRTARYNTSTGVLYIRTSQKQEYYL